MQYAGYFRTDRSVLDPANPILTSADQRYAWIWLVGSARYQDGSIWLAAAERPLRRGQLTHSIRHMARNWAWDEAKVRRFLAKLTKAGWITVATEHGQSLITISRYNELCPSGNPSESPSEPTQQPTGDRRSVAALTDAAAPQALSSLSPSEQREKEAIKNHIDAHSDAAATQQPTDDRRSVAPIKNKTNKQIIKEVREDYPQLGSDETVPLAPPKPVQADMLLVAEAPVSVAGRDVNRVVVRWNEMVSNLPAGSTIPEVRALNTEREKAVRKVLKAIGGLDGLDKLLGMIAASPWLTGQASNFNTTFDKVFIRNGREGAAYLQILEGNWANKAAKPRPSLFEKPSKHAWRDSYVPGQFVHPMGFTSETPDDARQRTDDAFEGETLDQKEFA